MKKVLLVLVVILLLTIGVSTFACPDKDLHEGVQIMLEADEIPIYLKGKKIVVETKKLSLLVLYESELDQEVAMEKIQTIISALSMYGIHHNLELEVLENK